MKKNERCIIQCSCGKIISSVSATKGLKPGTVIHSNGCYSCLEKIKDKRNRTGYLHG
jgi:hypothetical protein